MKKIIITGVLVGLGVYAYLEYSKKISKKPCSCSEKASTDQSGDVRSECEKKVHEQMKTMRFITADMMNNHKSKAVSSCIESNS
jgi:hypothetical protein